MRLRYTRNLIEAVDGMQKISALTWSPNSMRLAVSTANRVVHLFDENGEHKDKFPTKPAEKGQNSYVVRAMAFSPDSARLAIAQSDNIVFVYKLGTEWFEKKAICNKFPQSSSVTCLVWPTNKPHDLIFGLAEGKVKVGQTRSNKAQTLYSIDNYVAAVASSLNGDQIVSGHLDGSIYKYNIETQKAVKIAQHSSPPFALDWGEHICAAGNDGRVIFYKEDGNVLQRFDYTYDTAVKEFTTASFNPSGDTIVLGNFNRFYVYQYNPKRMEWAETDVKQIENLYSVTALTWKLDGSKLVIGSLCGSCDIFDACLKKARYKDMYEFTYVSPSQVIVKEIATGMRIAIKSDYGYEIMKINVYQNKFLVASTNETLLLGDMESCKMSEVVWRGSGKEKYDFSNPGVCMVFNAGELTLVEYGQNELMGSCRTEYMNPNLISARLNYGKVKNEDDFNQATRIMAYLLDLTTICVQDLNTGANLTTINHDVKVDFLELNPSGTKLLFRDKRRQLHLYNIKSQERSTLLQFCSYVQWVPNSDVVVAQSRQNLNVWYNIEDPDKVTVYNIKGDVEDIERSEGRTEVIVNEGVGTVNYALDEPLIEFGFAIESRNLERAVQILAPLDMTPESEAHWNALAKISVEEQNLLVAEQCYSALGDVSKARFIHKVNKMADKHKQETGQDGIFSYQVQANLAMLEKQFQKAEVILLDQNQVEEAMEMYQEMHKWDGIIAIAERRNHPKTHELKANYFQWLLQSNQEEKAAELKEREGDLITAINLYLKGGLPARAANVVNKHGFTQSGDVMEQIASALENAEMHEKAGEFFEKMDQQQKALDAYVKGSSFRKAVDLSRRYFKNKVVLLEEQWGDYLVTQKQMDAAINHFIEAGSNQKAIEAAISARQWSKAENLVASQSPDVARPYYRIIAKHYADVRQLENAEKFFLKAGSPNEVFEMYTQNNKWDAAYNFASKHMPETEVTLLYIKQAQKLEGEGHFKDAERMYLTVNEPDLAINMYKKAKQYDNMIRLVSKHRKEMLRDTHLYLAGLFEKEGKWPDAEQHFVEAGCWNMAAELYMKHQMWEEALRVAKSYGGPKEIAEIARKWAATVGGEGGSKLLIKQGLVEAALEYEVDNRNFEEAFRLAENNCRHRLPDVHLRYALFLEDENRFKEAEEEFVRAGKPTEAINMHTHNQDFHSAIRVAKQFAPNQLSSILGEQAKFFVSRREFQKAEQCYIQAKQPEQAVNLYVEQRMRNDAIRVAKTHAPHLLQRIMDGPGTVADNAEEMRQSAAIWEQNGNYNRAIDAYLEITEQHTQDVELLRECWERAVTISMTYEKDRCMDVITEVSQRFKMIGRYDAAAELFANIGHYEEAVRSFLDMNAFDRAREIVDSIRHYDIAQSLYQMIDEKQMGQARDQGDVHGMMQFRPQEGIDMLQKAGDWEQAFENAKMQGPQVLNQVLLSYTTQQCQDGNFGEVARAFTLYGSPAERDFLSTYKTLALEILAECQEEEIYDLRIVLKNLLDNLEIGGTDTNNPVYSEFERYMTITAVVYLKNQCKQKNLYQLYSKCCISLVRYSAEIRVDKVFYDAGMACKEDGQYNMAFIFLRRYLDIAEAVDDPENGAAALTDTSDFDQTDIPTYNIPLPNQNFTSEAERDNIRDWVLQISVDQKVDQTLTTRQCDNCGTGIYAASLSCYNCQGTWLPCVITGFPVLRATEVECSNCRKPANRGDWNAFLMSNPSCPWCSSIQSQAY